MSRARAAELLLASGLGRYLPPADTELTWWTFAVEIGEATDRLLSAMTELRDERWVVGSVTPMPSAPDLPAHVGCVFRRLSVGEDQAMRMQSQPMIVPAPNLGRRS